MQMDNTDLIRVSPSRLKTHCGIAPALATQPNPLSPGEVIGRTQQASINDHFSPGIYFESCITGKEPQRRPGDGFHYDLWLASAKKDTKALIEEHANYIEENFIDLSSAEIGRRFEIPYEDFGFVLVGEEDYYGPYKDTAGNWRTGVLDIKYTESIEKMWTDNDRAKMAQVVIYAIVRAVGFQRHPLLDAIFDKIADREDPIIDARRFVSSVVIEPCAFMVVQKTRTPDMKTDLGWVYGPPMMKIFVSYPTAEDVVAAVRLITDYVGKFALAKESLAKKDYSVAKAIARPSLFKCTGVGAIKSSICPLIHFCPFGRNYFHQTETFNISLYEDNVN